MADAAAGVAISIIQPAVDAARSRYASSYADHYEEGQVKAAILSELQKIQDDTTALRSEPLKTAHQALQSWHDSTEPIGSPNNQNYLLQAKNKAREAFNLEKDPINQIRAVSILVYAEYHYVALTAAQGEASPDWCAGKREAQQLLKQYVNGMPKIASAAKEEFARFRPVFRDKKKRRRVLFEFLNLSAAVYLLFPQELNSGHPRFEHAEKAAFRACRKSESQSTTIPVALNLFLTEPMLWETLRGHSGWIRCCAVFANDTRLVSGSGDTTLKVWDLTNGQELLTLRGHTGHISCFAVFANDTRLVSGSYDENLKVWDLSNGQELHTLRGHTGWIECCAVFANDTRLVSGSYDKNLKVWDLSNGQVLHTLRGHTGWIYNCAVFANDTRLVSGSDDKTIIVWDLSNGRELHTLQGHTGSIFSCAVFANDTRLVSGSSDTTLKVWDISSGQELNTLRGHTEYIMCCAVFANDTRLVSGSNDKTLKVWDLKSGQEMHTLRGHTCGVNCCAVFATDTRLVSGSDDKTLKVWDLSNGQELHTLRGHTNWIRCCALFANDTRLVSGSDDKTLKVWDLPLNFDTSLALSQSN